MSSILTHEQECRKRGTYIIHELLDYEFLNSMEYRRLEESSDSYSFVEMYVLEMRYSFLRLDGSSSVEAVETMQLNRPRRRRMLWLRNAAREALSLIYKIFA